MVLCKLIYIMYVWLKIKISRQVLMEAPILDLTISMERWVDCMETYIRFMADFIEQYAAV
jgi:hypothetical protein